MINDKDILQAALVGLDQMATNIRQQLQQLDGGMKIRGHKAPPPAVPPGQPTGRKRLSAAARKRISAAQKKRWKEFHKAQGAAQ